MRQGFGGLVSTKNGFKQQAQSLINAANQDGGNVALPSKEPSDSLARQGYSSESRPIKQSNRDLTSPGQQQAAQIHVEQADTNQGKQLQQSHHIFSKKQSLGWSDSNALDHTYNKVVNNDSQSAHGNYQQNAAAQNNVYSELITKFSQRNEPRMGSFGEPTQNMLRKASSLHLQREKQQMEDERKTGQNNAEDIPSEGSVFSGEVADEDDGQQRQGNELSSQSSQMTETEREGILLQQSQSKDQLSVHQLYNLKQSLTKANQQNLGPMVNNRNSNINQGMDPEQLYHQVGNLPNMQNGGYQTQGDSKQEQGGVNDVRKNYLKGHQRTQSIDYGPKGNRVGSSNNKKRLSSRSGSSLSSYTDKYYSCYQNQFGPGKKIISSVRSSRSVSRTRQSSYQMTERIAETQQTQQKINLKEQIDKQGFDEKFVLPKMPFPRNVDNKNLINGRQSCLEAQNDNIEQPNQLKSQMTNKKYQEVIPMKHNNLVKLQSVQLKKSNDGESEVYDAPASALMDSQLLSDYPSGSSIEGSEPQISVELSKNVNNENNDNRFRNLQENIMALLNQKGQQKPTEQKLQDQVDKNILIKELQKHQDLYIKKCNELTTEKRLGNSIQQAKSILKRKIECQKYNYSLDMQVQHQTRYHGYIQLSQDETELEIWLKKPAKQKISQLKKQFTIDQNIYGEDLNSQLDQEPFDVYQIRPNGAEATSSQSQNSLTFKWEKSQSSCKLSEIQDIFYGGLSSRFWAYRKQLNSSSHLLEQLKQPAFFAWQCITLQIKNKDIDLVISSDKDMDALIEVLVWTMNTIDGNRDSANQVLQKLKQSRIEDQLLQKQLTKKNKQSSKFINNTNITFQRNIQLTQKEKSKIKALAIAKTLKKEESDDEFGAQLRQDIHRATCFKYKLMRIRIKISYMAFIRKQTVFELLLKAIYNSFVKIAKIKLEEQGDFTDLLVINKTQELAFRQIVDGTVGNIWQKIIEMNADDIKNQIEQKVFERIKYFGIFERGRVYFQNKVNVKRNSSIIKKRSLSQIESQNKRMQFQPAMAKDMFSNIDLKVKKQSCKETSCSMKNEFIDHDVQYHQKKAFSDKISSMLKKYEGFKVIVNLKAFQKIQFIAICIKKIEMARKIFLLDLEHGNESYILDEITQNHLPINYWYYDPIFLWVQDLFDKFNQQLYIMKSDCRLNFYQESSLTSRYLERLGFTTDCSRTQTKLPKDISDKSDRKDNPKNQNKTTKSVKNATTILSQQQTQYQKNNLRVESEDVLSQDGRQFANSDIIQKKINFCPRSRYMYVDPNIKNIGSQDLILQKTNKVGQNKKRNLSLNDIENNSIHSHDSSDCPVDREKVLSAVYRQSLSQDKDAKMIIRYCHRDEINQIRHPSIMLKSTFLCKMNLVKDLGKKNDFLKELEQSLFQTWDHKLQMLEKSTDSQYFKDKAIRQKLLKTLDPKFHDNFKQIPYHNDQQYVTKYLDTMISCLEVNLKKSVNKRRRQSIDVIRVSTAPKVDYQDKMQYINREIDRTMTYFSWTKKKCFLQSMMGNLHLLQMNNEIDIEQMIEKEQQMNQLKGLEQLFQQINETNLKDESNQVTKLQDMMQKQKTQFKENRQTYQKIIKSHLSNQIIDTNT